MRKYLFFLTVIFCFVETQAQQLLTENFTDTVGKALTSSGWTLAGNGGNTIITTSPGLNYAGYVLSGVANSTYLKSSGQDVQKNALLTLNSGTVYASFMIKTDTVNTAGDYFFGFINPPNAFVARVYLRRSSNGYYKVGLSKSNDTAIYAPDTFAIGGTALIAIKYKFITGTTTNDSAYLFHFTSGFPSSEPAVALIATNGKGSQDANSIGRVGLRQGTAGNAPSLSVDGIRMGQTWTDLNAATSTALGPIPNLVVNTITSNSARFQFNKPSGYQNANHTLLLFLKKGNKMNPGSPNLSPSYYTADSNFAGSGTPYQFDTAKCVYKGDSNYVIVSGLTPSTTYIVLGFAVTDADSVYSIAKLSNTFTTFSTAPSNSLGIFFTPTSMFTGRVTWFKGTNYNNTNHTQMVYIKEMMSINTGANTRDPNTILADTNFNGNGTRYQNDTAARCIYNGDNTTVNVYGLKPGTRYYVMVIGANVFDSAYSGPSTANGITPTGGPNVATLLRFTGRLENTSTFTWNRPTPYVDSTYTTLVFMRKDTFNTIYPAPSRNPNLYVADSNYNGNGSKFEGDTLAKCIYNGDSRSVGITNLKLNTVYYFAVYVVRTDSGMYSNPAYNNGRTMLDTVSNVKWTGINTSSANVSWTNPANYVNGTYNALVFLKAGSPMNVGTPSRPLNRITANANFGSGTKYQNDTFATCVFKGNGTSVNINNLAIGVVYYATVFIVRVTDSVYNYPKMVSGSTVGPAPVYTIGPLVKTSMTSGVVDSNGVRASIRGVVYGTNIRTSGLQFVLRDATGGITVFSNTKTFGYTVKEGDSIETSGTVSQVNGMAMIGGLDTIKFFNSGHNIGLPKPSVKPTETTENDFVIYQRVSFISPLTNWPSTGTVYVMNMSSGDSIGIRINPTSGLGGTAVPTGQFVVVGLGGQQSSSSGAPFAFDGYYVAPRKTADIYPYSGDSLSAFPYLVPATSLSLNLLLDTTALFTYKSGSAKIMRGSGNIYYTFLVDEGNGDFSLPLFGKACKNGGLDTTGTITHGELLNLFPGLGLGDSVTVKVTMIASLNSTTRLADQSVLVTFRKGTKPVVGLPVLENNALLIYPNPANHHIQIQSMQDINKIQIYNLQGILIQEIEHTNSMDTRELADGLYLISVHTDAGQILRRIEVRH